MHIGLFHTVQFPEGSVQQERFHQALDQAVFAEEKGFESVWLTEHHFSRHGIISDSLVVLSNLAARTTSVRLGTAVSVLPLHNPLRLAESAAVVDILSNGRLDFGVGRGYQPTEFGGFGVNIAEKAEMFDEAAEIIEKSWAAEEPFSFEGKHWKFSDAFPQPRPVQKPHPPMWLATDSPDGMESAAAHDWGVMLPQGSTLAAVDSQMKTYREVLARHGRQDSGRLQLARAMYVSTTDERAWDEFEGPYEQFVALASRLAGRAVFDKSASKGPFAPGGPLRDSVIVGSPESCIAALAKISSLGVDNVIVFVHLGGLQHEQILASMDLFAKEVLPAVSELQLTT